MKNEETLLIRLLAKNKRRRPEAERRDAENAEERREKIYLRASPRPLRLCVSPGLSTNRISQEETNLAHGMVAVFHSSFFILNSSFSKS
jgi:hypothetical protein